MGRPEGEYDFVVKSAKHVVGKFGPQLEFDLESVPASADDRSFGFKMWLDTDTKNEFRLSEREGFLESIGVKKFDWISEPDVLVGKYGRAFLHNKVNKKTGEVGKYLSVKKFLVPPPPPGLEVDAPVAAKALRPGDAGYLDAIPPWDKEDVPF